MYNRQFNKGNTCIATIQDKKINSISETLIILTPSLSPFQV